MLYPIRNKIMITDSISSIIPAEIIVSTVISIRTTSEGNLSLGNSLKWSTWQKAVLLQHFPNSLCQPEWWFRPERMISISISSSVNENMRQIYSYHQLTSFKPLSQENITALLVRVNNEGLAHFKNNFFKSYVNTTLYSILQLSGTITRNFTSLIDMLWFIEMSSTNRHERKEIRQPLIRAWYLLITDFIPGILPWMYFHNFSWEVLYLFLHNNHWQYYYSYKTSYSPPFLSYFILSKIGLSMMIDGLSRIIQS